MQGTNTPFRDVLEFLSHAKVWRCVPSGYMHAAGSADLIPMGTFPQREVDPATLPVRLAGDCGRTLDISHWSDGSSRWDSKLYAGKQSGPDIVSQMLTGGRHTKGIADLWKENAADVVADPLGVVTPMGGSSFKFDARKAWTSIDAGYSPDAQHHAIDASPVLELLAAIGLEHARPDKYEGRQVRYAAWGGFAPPALARAALGGAKVGLPIRVFRFELGMSGKNKVVTFAQEEAST